MLRNFFFCFMFFMKGKWVRSIAIYRPQSSSLVQEWMSWFSGRRPELIDPKSIACSEGRDGKHTFKLPDG